MIDGLKSRINATSECLTTNWTRWFAWHPVRIGGRTVWLRHVWRQDGRDPDPRRAWTKYRMSEPKPRRAKGDV